MHTRIRQYGDKWGVEFVEGPCPQSNIGIDLVQPLGAQIIDCFKEEWIHSYLHNLWHFEILPYVNRLFMSSHFATNKVRNNPSVIDISDSSMASNQSTHEHPAHASSEVEVELTRINLGEAVLVLK